jgi:signal transduction histidine kinase
MPPLFRLDIAALCVCAIISISLAMIALSFGPKHALNRYFALFALSQAVWAAFSIGLRLALWAGTGQVPLLLEIATLHYVLMGPFLLMFTLRYLDRSTRMADRVAVLGLIIIAFLSIPLFRHQLAMNPRLAPNGTTLVDLSLSGAAAAGLPAGYLVWSLVLLWRRLRRTEESYLVLSVFILVIGLVLGVVQQAPFPVLSITNTFSIAILGYGVLSKQIFNPLRERTAELQREIAERQRAEAQFRLQSAEVERLNEDLERRAHQLAALNQAGQAITSTLNPEAVLKMVIDEVKSLLDVEGASVLLRDPVKDELVFGAVAGVGEDTLVGTRMPTTAGIAGWVLRERQAALVQDAQRDSRFFAGIDAEIGLTTRSVVAVPLKFKASVWGVLEAVNKISGTFTQQDREMLEALASSAAIAIENANLYTSIQETNVQLRAALRAKDEMLQNVSHELRTPLAMLCGYSDALGRGDLGPLNNVQQRVVRIMERQGERLRFMVDRLIMLQSFEAHSLQCVRLDLSQWLRQAVQVWEERAAQAGLALWVETPPTLPVMADPSFFEHVTDNLLDNAVKFTPKGGQVQARAWAQGDEAIIAVSDTGVGIPPDKLQHVFERFYQVDGSSTRHFGGMGIGLALCRAIVEAHSGRIWAESAGADQGATFYVALPLARPKDDAAHAPESAEQ